MKLFDALSPEAQEDLVRDVWIDLVWVIVEVVPDPDRPDDRNIMKIHAEVYDAFLQGIPEIDAEMDRLQEICNGAEEDLSLSLRDDLLAALNLQRDDLKELREGLIGGQPAGCLADPVIAELIRPSLENPVIDVPVWCLYWTVAMEDDGKLMVDSYERVYADGVDDVTRSKVYDRMRKMNAVIGNRVRKLMGEG